MKDLFQAIINYNTGKIKNTFVVHFILAWFVYHMHDLGSLAFDPKANKKDLVDILFSHDPFTYLWIFLIAISSFNFWPMINSGLTFLRFIIDKYMIDPLQLKIIEYKSTLTDRKKDLADRANNLDYIKSKDERLTAKEKELNTREEECEKQKEQNKEKTADLNAREKEIEHKEIDLNAREEKIKAKEQDQEEEYRRLIKKQHKQRDKDQLQEEIEKQQAEVEKQQAEIEKQQTTKAEDLNRLANNLQAKAAAEAANEAKMQGYEKELIQLANDFIKNIKKQKTALISGDLEVLDHIIENLTINIRSIQHSRER